VIPFLGDYAEDAALHFEWGTNIGAGGSVTRATDGEVRVYKDDGVAQSTAGVTDTEDFDGLTGLHQCAIDLSADAFYATGHDYHVVLAGAVIDGQTVNAPLAHFSIENRWYPASSTTPTGTDITGVEALGNGVVEGSFGAGSDADRYLVFAKKGSAPTLLTEDSAEHVLTVPGGQTSFRLTSGVPAGTFFDEGDWYFIVKGKNDASGNLDTNTTAMSTYVLPIGVGAQKVTVEDVDAFTGKLTVADLEKVFNSAARVPVAGEADGEPIDMEASTPVPVKGKGGTTAINIKSDEGLKKVKLQPVDVNARFSLENVLGALNRIAEALDKLGGLGT